MNELYCWANAIMYAVLGAYCAIAARRAADTLGLSWTTSAGHSEFITVFGGMEIGMALIFGAMTSTASMARTGVLIGLLLYACLVMFRAISLITLKPSGRTWWLTAIIELVLLIWAAVLWWSPYAASQSPTIG